MLNIYKTGLLATLLAVSLSASAECTPGVYKDDKHHLVVITDTIDIPSTGFKYLLLDGRFGTTLSTSKPFECDNNFITFRDERKIAHRLFSTALIRTKTTFTSAETELTGELI